MNFIDWSAIAIPSQPQTLRATHWTLAALLALLSLTATPPVAAQEKGHFEIGLGLAALELDSKLGGDTGLGSEGRVGYFVTDRFQLEIQHTSASAILDGSFQVTTLNGLYYFGSNQRSFSPYGLLGVGRAEVRLDDVIGFGVAGDATDDTLAFRAALGARVALGTSDRTSLRLEATALKEEAFGDDATHIGLSSTFFWHLGGRGR